MSEDEDRPEGSRRIRDGGSGRETEDEMRKRIIEEIDKERADLEREIKELKEKEDSLRGKLASWT